MRWAAVTWIVVCGCGRVGFEDLGDGAQPATRVAVSYPTENLTAVLGLTPLAVTPTVTGGPVAFSVSPVLPAGLALSPTTGAITGTPTEAADHMPYVVTAQAAGGSVSATLYANVLPGYVVDTTADGTDDDGGTDVTCHSAAANGCSLRAAIQTVNRRATKQLVLLGANVYTIGSSLETFSADVVVAGAGPDVTTIKPPTVHPGYGMAALTANDAMLLDLHVADFGSVDGAVISQTGGTLWVDECDFTRNDSNGSGGVFYAQGTAVTIDHSTFEANSSFGGCCGGWGGVIDAEGSAVVHVNGITATGNTGGWGSFAHITTGVIFQMENSTLYGNTSTISGTLASPGGGYILVNDTIAFNTNTNATPDDSNLASAGIYLYNPPASYVLENVLLVHNTLVNGNERNCSHRVTGTPVTSNGGNLLSDDAYNCGGDFAAATDRRSSDAGLEAQAPSRHGGLVPTMLLAPGAAAIDTGLNANCPAVDARGVARPVGPQCDVGAVEME